MNSTVKKEIEAYLDNCNNKNYPMVCKKKNFADGKELVVNEIYNRLSRFPSWNIKNALADVEVYLNGFEND